MIDLQVGEVVVTLVEVEEEEEGTVMDLLQLHLAPDIQVVEVLEDSLVEVSQVVEEVEATVTVLLLHP